MPLPTNNPESNKSEESQVNYKNSEAGNLKINL
jgi:hypothetical protein